MNLVHRRSWQQLGILAALVVLGPASGAGNAQFPLDDSATDFRADLILPRDYSLFAGSGTLETSPTAADAGSRFRLFRMPSGFLSTPIELDTDDDVLLDPVTGLPIPDVNDNRLALALGSDNPYFDFRGRGDLGGVGYYKLHTQYQLLDTRSTSLSVGLMAATPAGVENDGVAGGPTSLKPTLAWYQELEGGTAVHGFVGKSLIAGPRWTDNLERSVAYGVAVQSPFPGLSPPPGHSVHLFVEALGRSRLDDNVSSRPGSTWEFLPGLHWQVGPRWWLSGGMILPVEAPRIETNLWQFTCSWRF
jgi:hypothetical protein